MGRIYVRSIRPGAWRFAGISRYDGALRGGLGRAAEVLPAYGPRYDDFCQLMLHLLAEPAEARDPSQRESLFGLCTERRPAPAIAGGSDAQGGEQTGWVSSVPPAQQEDIPMSPDGIRLYDPTAQPRAIVAQLAPRLASLAGKRIGILDNSKANAGTLMLAVAKTLQQRYGAGEIVKRDKPVAGPPSPEALAALSACDLALVGSAD